MVITKMIFLMVEIYFFIMLQSDHVVLNEFVFFFDHVFDSIYCPLCYYYMTEIASKYYCIYVKIIHVDVFFYFN